ncbi:MAG: hypothetical protein ACI9GZ_003522 [Bacteroidia bacterium]
MKLQLAQKFSGIIRSIKTTEDQSLLCIENVKEESSIPNYNIIDLNKTKLLESNIAVKPSKTLVLKTIVDNFLVLNEYSNGQNPDKARAIVYDYKNKRINWEKENFNIIDIKGKLIKSPHQYFEGRYSYWDIESGSIVESDENENLKTEKNEYFPLCYPETNEYFSWFAKVISGQKKHMPRISCEYLELNDKIIISYYYMEKEALNNSLIVLDSYGQTIESIKLGENLKGIGKDTFFAIENHLIFISYKNTLNIYEV